MLRSDLIKWLGEELGDPMVADATVACVFETLIAQLEAGGRAELRGFGSFSVRSYRARSARNPRSGEAVAVVAKSRVHFKASRRLLALLTSGDARQS